MRRKVTTGLMAFGRAEETAHHHDTNQQCSCIGKDSSVFKTKLILSKFLCEYLLLLPGQNLAFQPALGPFTAFESPLRL